MEVKKPMYPGLPSSLPPLYAVVMVDQCGGGVGWWSTSLCKVWETEFKQEQMTKIEI